MNKETISENITSSIEVAARWGLFEFNDERARNRFTTLMNELLETAKENKIIESYFVKCDEDVGMEFSGTVYYKLPDMDNFVKIAFCSSRTDVDFEGV